MPRSDNSLKLADGRTLGYSVFGDRSGRAVLYFHGGLSSRLDIEFADKQLSELEIKLIAPDRPGIGLSDRLPGRTLTDWTNDAAALITALDLKKPPVLGWSLGGPYALACAALLSDKIGSLGTVGGVGPMDYEGAVNELGLMEDRILLSWPEPLLQFLSPAGSLYKFMSPQKMKQELLRAVKSGPDYEVCDALSLSEATDFAFEAIRQGFYGSLDDYLALRKPWGFKVEDIKMEVLMWQGLDDHLCSRRAGDKLASRLQKKQYFLLENSGHFLLHRHLADVMSILLKESDN
ncbi:MAG: hypothetical protein C0507_19300 [Cyanobacteria bacterium PR.3.49]|nr:hypothetical protein [Cyanobacteria bacterium PR.3.49]